MLIVFKLLESYRFFLALEAITIAVVNCQTSFMCESSVTVAQCTLETIQDGGVKNSVFTQAQSSRIALLVRNLIGKILYLCILIPQSEYIKIQVYVTRKPFFGSFILSTH